MSAVAADQQMPKHEIDLALSSGPVAASTILYAKTACFKTYGGYLDDDTASGANRFAGINRERVDNSAGSNGDLNAELITEGRFELAISGSSVDDVGKPVYATSNYDFTLNGSASGAVYIGRYARYVSSTKGMVELDVNVLSTAVMLTGALGYVTGAGGAVTQITSRATGVTLSKLTGQITTDSTSLAAAAEATFTVTNTLVAATDLILLNITPGGTGTPHAYVSAVAAGSFDITITNLHAATADTSADVINFAVIKGVNA